MNQKDNKDIAGIINKRWVYLDTHKLQSAVGGIKAELRGLINDFADYFEKKDNEFNKGIKYRAFNKKQFLKDCGVDTG